MNRSMPVLPVHHQLPEFTQTHAHRVGDAIQPSHPLLSPAPLAPNPSQHQGLFQDPKSGSFLLYNNNKIHYARHSLNLQKAYWLNPHSKPRMEVLTLIPLLQMKKPMSLQVTPVEKQDMSENTEDRTGSGHKARLPHHSPSQATRVLRCGMLARGVGVEGETGKRRGGLFCLLRISRDLGPREGEHRKVLSTERTRAFHSAPCRQAGERVAGSKMGSCLCSLLVCWLVSSKDYNTILWLVSP